MALKWYTGYPFETTGLDFIRVTNGAHIEHVQVQLIKLDIF